MEDPTIHRAKYGFNSSCPAQKLHATNQLRTGPRRHHELQHVIPNINKPRELNPAPSNPSIIRRCWNNGPQRNVDGVPAAKCLRPWQFLQDNRTASKRAPFYKIKGQRVDHSPWKVDQGQKSSNLGKSSSKQKVTNWISRGVWSKKEA